MWRQEVKPRSRLTSTTLTLNSSSNSRKGQTSLNKSASGCSLYGTVQPRRCFNQKSMVSRGPVQPVRLGQSQLQQRHCVPSVGGAAAPSAEREKQGLKNVNFSPHKMLRNQPNGVPPTVGINIPETFHPAIYKGPEEGKRARFRKPANPFVSETKRSFGLSRGQSGGRNQKGFVKSGRSAKLSGRRTNSLTTIQGTSKIPLFVNLLSPPAKSKSGLNLYNPSFSGDQSATCGNLMSGLPERESTTTIMLSKKSELSLLEQKKLQWAKEREELNGLWSPWGRPSLESKSTSALYDESNQTQSQPTNAIPASYVTKLGISAQAVGYSQSDVYLPPIKGTMSHQHQVQHQRSTTWAIKNSSNNNKNDSYNSSDYFQNNRPINARKSSLPNGNFSTDEHPMYHHPQQYESMESHSHGNNNNQMSRSYHNDGSVFEMDGRTYYSGSGGGGKSKEWASLGVDEVEGGYHTSGYQSENNNEYHTSGEEVSNRKYDGDFDHYEMPQSRQKQVEGFAHPRSSNGPSPRVIVHKILVDPNSRPNTNSGGGRGGSEYIVNSMTTQMSPSPITSNRNLSGISGRSYGGSTGCLSGVKPPPVAMRSSLTIGVGSAYAGSYEDVQRQEREQWLSELDKQREEQRIRKLMEKEDKRARWGDKGIGVGHFWEPADSSYSRLPATPNNRDGGGGDTRAGETAQVSPTPPAWLERSLTRMQSSKSQPNLTNEQLETLNESSNLFINQSSIDLRNITGASPENEERTFIRGQNVPIDPNLREEMEKKRQANQEHLEAIKKQIEERQQKLKDEKEKRIQEEREHEVRITQQRELELKRLEMEKRKHSALYSDKPEENTESGNATEVSVQIFESGKSKVVPPFNHRDASTRESPLIPHQIIHEPDAYELEIARRQSMLLSSSTDEVQRSNSSIELRTESSSAKSYKRDQCLMTDTDHIYERTLTPTKERRSWSLDRSLREFGTQTEGSDAGLTTSEEKSAGKNRSKNSVAEEKSKSKDTNVKKKADEKPRWGANPVKKQYLKQSEKDPNYQKMKRRSERIRPGCDTGTGTDESENQNIPFLRIRSRKSQSPTRASHQGPLKALHFKTETNPKTKSPGTAVQDSPTRRAPLKKNYPSDPSLNKRGLSSMNGIVNKNLGSIGGLNSVGTSEESGSGFTSPSFGNRNHSGSLRSDEPSPEIPEYIPEFSKEFIPQRDFDEMPINAGKIAPGFQQTFGVKNSQPEQIENAYEPPVVRQRKPIKSSSKPKTRVGQNSTKAPAAKTVHENHRDPFENDDIPVATQERLQSPPVPALLKKMQMGFQPDESGRLSSLPTEFPEILSPIPTVSIGSGMATPIPSRLSSAAPKIDIDIAVTSGSNPDLRRILETVQEQERLRDTTTTTDSESNSNNNRRDSERFKLPHIAHHPNVVSGRSYQSYASRPMTMDSDLSLQVQEDFIRELMKQKDVQEQLSARESELSEKGIIEFNIRLPSRWGNGNGGISSRANSSKSKINNNKDRPLEEYKDPLLSERRRQTAKWLHSMDDSPKEAILTNLSSLKQGIQMHQKKLNLTAYDDSTTDTEAD